MLQEMERDLKAEQTNIREVQEERTKDIAELTQQMTSQRTMSSIQI